MTSWKSVRSSGWMRCTTESEDRIHRIINTVPGLHWSARPDGWVDVINQRWLDYTGMTLEQALGWGWTPAYHPDEIANRVGRG
jgi:PAS domain-containing protein